MYRSHCTSLLHRENQSIELSFKCLEVEKGVKNDYLKYGALLNLAITYAKIGSLEKALDIFSECLLIAQESSEISKKEEMLININKAQAFLRHGFYQDGLTCLNSILGEMENFQVNSNIYVGYMLIKAQLKFQANQLEESFETFDFIIKENKKHENQGHTFISKCYLAYLYYTRDNKKLGTTLYDECKILSKDLNRRDNIYYIWCISKLDFFIKGPEFAIESILSSEKKVLKQCELNHAFFYRSVAQIFNLAGDDNSSQKYNEKAKKIYKRLNSNRLLAEIN